MSTEVLSRLLTLAVVAAFAWLLARGRLPVIPRGRWTALAFAAAGLGMCTLAGMRDGIGAEASLPTWLAIVFTGLGIGAAIAVLAVILGVNWQIGIVAVGALIAVNWAFAFGWAIATHAPSVVSGWITLAAAAVTWFAVGWMADRPRVAGGAMAH
jgi:hypothetical protein